MPLTYLAGAILPMMGKHEKAYQSAAESLKTKPENSVAYGLFMLEAVATDRPAEGEAAYRESIERKLFNPFILQAKYYLAFLANDGPVMAEMVEASKALQETRTTMIGIEADTAAYSGHLRKARELSRQGSESEGSANEITATLANIAALREAVFGNTAAVRRSVVKHIDNSTARDVRAAAAFALAFAGDSADATTVINDLAKEFPDSLIIQRNYLPTVRAKVALNKGDADGAIAILEATKPYELGQTTYSRFGWNAMYPVYVRGEAYLAAKRGAEAAQEFQRILAHRGVVLNEPIAATARVGLARAYAMQGDSAKARTAYEDFLDLWKEADPDVPILVGAKAEYAKLK
jgi:eukaryotic-like serine/threonine-protein kinase